MTAPGRRRRTDAVRGMRRAPLVTQNAPDLDYPPLRRARDSFFLAIERDGDLGLAAVTTVKRHIEQSAVHRARTFAQVLQQEDGRVGEVGDICMAIVATHSGLLPDAWRLFGTADIADVLRFAPVEYFRVGFAVEPDVATKTLKAVLRGEWPVHPGPAGWLDIAQISLAAGAVDASRTVLDRAAARLSSHNDPQLVHELGERIDRLRPWYAKAAAAGKPAPLGEDEIAIAVVGYKQPDPAETSDNLGDYLDSLAVLAQLARRTGMRFSGPADLVAVGETLRHRVPTEQAIPGGDAVVRLYEVDRDATSFAAVPAGTWLIVTGVLPRQIFGLARELPFDARLRPIFLSVHVDDATLLTPKVVDYLRRHAPIGCRDWSTVLLLQSAGVPAVFTGAVAATIDTIGGEPSGRRARRLNVDGPATARADNATQVDPGLRTGSLAANLLAALHLVDGYRGYREIVTSRLRTYLCARALGVRAEFAPQNPACRAYYGVTELTDAAFDTMRATLADRLAALHGAILARRRPEDVYALWERLCAPDLARAQALQAELPTLPPSQFDFRAACATIRSAAVTIERCAPAPAGNEINVELSLDGNYKHQLEVVLDSIVTSASRPIRAFVLCREHTPADFDRMAALFPSVSFVWLPTDSVEYGTLRGLLDYTTVATMDRLLLPDLLPEVRRIIHHDLDALCISDIAELYDTDLRGTPLGGVRQPQLKTISGFNSFLNKSETFHRRPAVGREYLRISHGRHALDFDVLNAGIMLLDLEAMRADDFCEQFLPYVHRYGMNDQGVLNVYAGGNRVEIDEGWNWRPWLGAVAQPKIAHWAGPYKPWKRAWVLGKDLWQVAEARVDARYARAGLRRNPLHS